MIIINGRDIMLNQKIIFSKPNTAELLKSKLNENLTTNNVLVKTEFTTISAGTERDNLKGEPNLNCVTKTRETTFPRQLGYSGVGIVLKTGPSCKNVKIGERVIIYFGTHSQYNIIPETQLFPILFDNITNEEAALLVIAGFPAEGVRKTRLEFGESALVMGLGILGLIAVQLCKIGGAVPVIAVDTNPERRKLALDIGADFALDPADTNFYADVLKYTHGKGIDIAVDSAGNANATSQALDCLAMFGRITLLGCTRHHGEYDLYHLVHGKGVSMIGANNVARPNFESRPGNWTALDDNYALQKLLHTGRLSLKPLINEIHSPVDAPKVYERLAFSDNFPIGVLFDWNKLD